MKKDLIIGAYTNYDWAKVKYWANSIDRCGFTGDKAVIVYHSDIKTAQRLSTMGFNLTTFGTDPNTGNLSYPHQLVIVVHRFIHLWQYVNSLPNIDDYRYVITTDVKDVIFQSNPSLWLEQNLGDKKIVASCESLKYKDEPWGKDNFEKSYPLCYDQVKNNPIWNCGVQAGDIRVMKDLWLQIFLTCHAAALANPDQAAYNLLLDMNPWKDITKFTMSEDGWACQAGTTVDPLKIDGFRPNLLESEPKWNGQKVTTSNSIEHVVLHQWDRVPAWHSAIETLYG